MVLEMCSGALPKEGGFRVLSPAMKRLPLCILALACGSSPAPNSESPENPPAENAPADEAPTPSASATYDLHEWGLVDIDAAGEAELAAGPGQLAPAGRPERPAATRKPVLYFHLVDGDALDVQVTAAMRYGAMLEHFPSASGVDARTLRWDVRLASGDCGPRTYPGRGDARCTQVPDRYCEAAELARYEAADATCLKAGGADFNHLFYRGGGTGLVLPVRVTPGAEPGLQNMLGDAVVPLAFLIEGGAGASRELRGRRAAMQPPSIRRLGPVAANATAQPGEVVPVGVAVQETRAALAQLGLTPDEVQAFMNAWERPVFQQPNVARSVFYLLPERAVGAISAVTAVPAPRSFRRAMAVRQAL